MDLSKYFELLKLWQVPSMRFQFHNNLWRNINTSILQSSLNCASCAPSRIRALSIIDTCLTCLRTLPIINTRFMRLRIYAPLPSSIGALRAFILCCVVLLQLKGKVQFAFALQLAIHPLSLSSLLFDHIKLFYMLFFFFILSYWLHYYLYNYFVTATFSHFQFWFFFK